MLPAVEVVERLAGGARLSEEHGRAAGERLQVDAMGGHQRHDPPGESLLAAVVGQRRATARLAHEPSPSNRSVADANTTATRASRPREVSTAASPGHEAPVGLIGQARGRGAARTARSAQTTGAESQ